MVPRLPPQVSTLSGIEIEIRHFPFDFKILSSLIHSLPLRINAKDLNNKFIRRSHWQSDFDFYPKENRQARFFDKHFELKKRYWGRHFWVKGYCVSIVGLDEERIRQVAERER